MRYYIVHHQDAFRYCYVLIFSYLGVLWQLNLNLICKRSITSTVELFGTVQDTNLAAYTVAVAPVGSDAF
ncbi:hypothetical protein, partial [Pseudanabaena sp. PCC 6802]|uniref:hypothetical protein n=1 Tax=Pseudanabaena sp. PCC 6802 TaxID=118173 RepID=UPI001CEDFC9A